MRWKALFWTIVVVCSAALAAQAITVPVTFAWTRDSTHNGATWEAEVDGVSRPCPITLTTATELRCTAASVALGTHAFRLRGTANGQVGDWSESIVGAISAPGPFTIHVVWTSAPTPPPPPPEPDPMAIVFANVSSEGKLEPSADPETTDHTIASTLSDGYVLVGLVGFNVGSAGAAVTFDGSLMTQLASVTQAAFGGAYITNLYGLAIGNKASGTYVVSVNLDDTWDEYNVGILTYNGVHQTVSVGTAVTASGNSATPSVVATSAAGELVVDSVTLGGNSGAPHVSQTQRWLQATSTGGGMSEEAGAASVTMSWSQTSGRWTIAAVPLKPSAASGRVAKNTRAWPHGVEIGMGWRMPH